MALLQISHNLIKLCFISILYNANTYVPYINNHMRIVPNYRDLQRAKRLATNSKLSFNSVVNNGSPSSQGSAIPPDPTPTPTVPANALRRISGDVLNTVDGTILTTIQ
jgi:hypothetical protein